MLQQETAPEAKALVEKAIVEVGEIATLPEVTVKIIEIVENPKSTARELHDVIKNDPALSARILKVVNSAFYGLPGQISSIDRAIVLLGLSAVKNIAIAASMTHLFTAGRSIEGFSGAEVWKHSIGIAVGSRLLSAAQGRPQVEESFLAGLICDLGLLVERQLFCAELAEIVAGMRRNDGADFCRAEVEIIGADHQAFGMALGKKWRFPQTLCTTIGYHHNPMDLAEANRELPAIVNVADLLACRAEVGFCQYPPNVDIPDALYKLIKLDEAKVDEIFDELPEQVSIAESIFGE